MTTHEDIPNTRYKPLVELQVRHLTVATYYDLVAEAIVYSVDGCVPNLRIEAFGIFTESTIQRVRIEAFKTLCFLAPNDPDLPWEEDEGADYTCTTCEASFDAPEYLYDGVCGQCSGDDARDLIEQLMIDMKRGK